MLKFSRGKLIVFDIEEALSFEGETGPYLQYAVVRANNILQKLQDREGVSEADVLGALHDSAADELEQEDGHTLWAIAFEASRLDDVVEQVVRRSSSRCWRSTRSGSRRCSTGSITAIRS